MYDPRAEWAPCYYDATHVLSAYAIYNNRPLPLTDTTDGIAGSASAASCDPPAFACYAQAFLRVWDPDVQPAIAEQWNLTVQHQFGHESTFQIGYVGQKGTHLMVPFDYAQRVLLSNGSTAPSPYFAKNPTLYTVLGNPALGGEGATVSGTRSNGNVEYNSFRQHWVLWSLGKCQQRVRVLAKCV